MPHLTRQQEKAMFAKMNKSRTRSKLTPEMQTFLSRKIRKNIKEGRKPKQAVAIAFSQARKKFGNARLRSMPNNPRDDNKSQRRIRNLLVTLFGVAIALQILRRARKT